VCRADIRLNMKEFPRREIFNGNYRPAKDLH
jgi:hypothetical protein